MPDKNRKAGNEGARRPLLACTHITGLAVVWPVWNEEGEDPERGAAVLHAAVHLLAARDHRVEVGGDQQGIT